jgi:hypothetical protein
MLSTWCGRGKTTRVYCRECRMHAGTHGWVISSTGNDILFAWFPPHCFSSLLLLFSSSLPPFRLLTRSRHCSCAAEVGLLVQAPVISPASLPSFPHPVLFYCFLPPSVNGHSSDCDGATRRTVIRRPHTPLYPSHAASNIGAHPPAKGLSREVTKHTFIRTPKKQGTMAVGINVNCDQ